MTWRPVRERDGVCRVQLHRVSVGKPDAGVGARLAISDGSAVRRTISTDNFLGDFLSHMPVVTSTCRLPTVAAQVVTSPLHSGVRDRAKKKGTASRPSLRCCR